VEMFAADPQKSENFGRIINDSAWVRLNSIVEQSRGKIYVGGRTDKADKYIEPTILDYGTDGAGFDRCPAMQDEIFGPILPLLRYTNMEEDVVRRIRSLPTGKPLAMYVFAEDAKVVDTFTNRMTSGGLCINDTLMHIANADLPFGGVGQSGMGSYHGERSVKCFSHEKAVLTKYSALDQNPLLKWALAARYPPWDDTRKFLAAIVTNPGLSGIKEVLEGPWGTRLMMVILFLIVKRALGLRLVRD